MGKILDAVVAVGEAAVNSAAAPIVAADEIARDGTISDDTVSSLVGGEISDAAVDVASDLISSED